MRENTKALNSALGLYFPAACDLRFMPSAF